MSTHNPEALIIDALLDAVARMWLADFFTMLDQGMPEYATIREKTHEEIAEVLARFRVSLNELPCEDLTEDHGDDEPKHRDGSR